MIEIIEELISRLDVEVDTDDEIISFCYEGSTCNVEECDNGYLRLTIDEDNFESDDVNELILCFNDRFGIEDDVVDELAKELKIQFRR